jgi:hypothetical protein
MQLLNIFNKDEVIDVKPNLEVRARTLLMQVPIQFRGKISTIHVCPNIVWLTSPSFFIDKFDVFHAVDCLPERHLEIVQRHPS